MLQKELESKSFSIFSSKHSTLKFHKNVIKRKRSYSKTSIHQDVKQTSLPTKVKFQRKLLKPFEQKSEFNTAFSNINPSKFLEKCQENNRLQNMIRFLFLSILLRYTFANTIIEVCITLFYKILLNIKWYKTDFLDYMFYNLFERISSHVLFSYMKLYINT